MASRVQPLAALIDPIDGVRLPVEARRWLWPIVALSLNHVGNVAQLLRCACPSGLFTMAVGLLVLAGLIGVVIFGVAAFQGQDCRCLLFADHSDGRIRPRLR